eukprot:1105863-Amphidinium_carterae.1
MPPREVVVKVRAKRAKWAATESAWKAAHSVSRRFETCRAGHVLCVVLRMPLGCNVPDAEDGWQRSCPRHLRPTGGGAREVALCVKPSLRCFRSPQDPSAFYIVMPKCNGGELYEFL